MKGKSIFVWAMLITIVALLLFFINFTVIRSYDDVETVYVVGSEIQMDSQLKESDFVKKSFPKRAVPSDAIIGDKIKEVDNKYARVTLLQGDILVQRMVSEANSIRDITRNTSMNVVSIAIPLDLDDMPATAIKNGDIISMVGVTIRHVDGQDVVDSQYTVENIRVAEVIDDSRSGRSKIIALIPREAAPEVVKILRTGKYNIVIDPTPYKPPGPAFKLDGKVIGNQ